MTRMYEVWFAIPSASVERCRKVLPKWREMGYKIAVLQNVERGEIPADIVKWSDTYPGWPESINILCRDIVPKSADIVVSGGCDMLPDPNHTAQQLAEQFYQRFPDGFGVMQPHGDHFMEVQHYCGSPFLGRKWIDTMYEARGPMPGMYRHNWADNELYWVARCLNALWCRTDLVHFHEHFTRDNTEKPSWWVQNVERNDRSDIELFLSRKYTCFPGHAPKGVDRKLDTKILFEQPMGLAERCYQARYGGNANRMIETALRTCASRGLKPVAIYGAGRHTLNAAESLAQPQVPVACIIDDNPARHGKRLWGYEIVSRDEALRRGVKAVLLSSDSAEGALWDNCTEFAARNIPVFRFYDPPATEKNLRVRRAFDRCDIAGRRRVALYGAGAHTRELKECLVNPPIELICIIDDAAAPGTVLHGLPVVTPDSALRMRLDAVVLSSNRSEERMWEQTAKFRESGIEVVRLYDKPGAPGVSPTLAAAV